MVSQTGPGARPAPEDAAIPGPVRPEPHRPGPEGPPRLTVVLINWRMAHDLPTVLPSIAAQRTDFPFEAILVNKPSGDGAEEIAARFPWLRVIAHEVFGIAEMRNVGIRAGRGEFLLMLDADTEVLPGCFQALVDFMDRHPRVGALGAHTKRRDGSLEYNVKRFYDLTTIAVRRSPLGVLWPDNPWNRRHLMMDKDHGRAFEGDWVAGACFCMRREAIQETGLFDDRYAFGFEDTDWCWRAKRLGWRVAWTPKARIIHRVQRKSAAGINRLTWEHLRSGLLFWQKVQRLRGGGRDDSPRLDAPAVDERPAEPERGEVDLSIIIVNVDERDLLRACLASLPAACEGITWEAIVVDNASADGSASMVRDEFPRAKRVENDENLGFSAANNQGLEIAEGRFLMLLNNDTEALPGSLAGAVRWMQQHGGVGAAGLKLLNSDGSRQLSCRRFPSFEQALFNRYSLLTKLFPRNRWSARYLMTDLEDAGDEVRDVDWVSGACLLFRRSVLDDIGPLDDDFWMYSEDVDFCLRVWRSGRRVAYLPVGEVVHHIGRSTARFPFKPMVQRHRSMWLFYKKHYSRELLFVDAATAAMVWGRCGLHLLALGARRLLAGGRRTAS